MPHLAARFARPTMKFGSDGKQGRETKQRPKAPASLGAQRDGLERPGRRKAAGIAFVVLSGAGAIGAPKAATPARRGRRFGRGAKASPTGFVCPARRQWPEFWKAMIVGERRFFSAFPPVEQPTLRRQACDCGRGLVEGEGHAGPLLGSDFEPAPSAKRNRRPMRGAFRSSRFVLPFCGVARAVAPATRKGAQSAAMRHRAWAWPGEARRLAPQSAKRAPRRRLTRRVRARIRPTQTQIESAGCADSGAANGRPIGAGALLGVARVAVAVTHSFPTPVIRNLVGDGGASITTPTRRSICWWRWG